MIFDAEFQRRLEVLKRIVARALAGRGGSGRSPFHERGGRVEFASHRAYASGDDARTVDWAAYARLETLVVKEFEAPREADLLLVLDRSESMRLFGKDEAALRLAAALGWLGLAAGARVACTASGGASRWLSAPERLPDLLEALEGLPAGGVAELPRAVERAPPAGTGRRTSVVVSDFYESEDMARAVSALGRRSAAVICVHLLAPEELHAPDLAAVRLRDAESGEILTLALNAAARRGFHEKAETFLADRAALAARHGARLALISPRDDLIAGVERILLGRSAA